MVRTPHDKIELIVAYGGLFGWGARPVAVPIEVVGIQGRELASLDMPRSEYAAAPTWRDAGAQRAARRRDDPGRAGSALSADDHDLVKLITFWCLPTCTAVSRN